MIERRQAEQLAAVWARRDSDRLGFPCTPVVEEFELGWLITSDVTPDARALPGDLPTTVVDKETGDLSTWPRLPFPMVERMFLERRPTGPPPPRTVDAGSQLLRELSRLPTPGAAAHLTRNGRTWIRYGAKGEVELRHHPLVRAYLDELPPGHLVRGGDRHAEMIVVSDVLHEYDQQRVATGQPPASLEEARTFLGDADLEFFRIREPGDPAGGRAELPCDSCINFLVHVNALPWSDLAYTQMWRPGPQAVPDPDPGRFPPEIAASLVIAGWRPHFGDEVLAAAAIRDVTAVRGKRHTHAVFPAATSTITTFPGLNGKRRGPGEEVWISRLDIVPWKMGHTADTLADFGGVLGVRLFPLGTERGDSIIAVDEHGRIFALDQAGEWFLGPDIDAALTTLLLGRAPARVRDDGTW
ncbi:SUKH-3 domain-containing protein [Micromonospora mangrovi]|uniref:SUKH-3 domain-containing protein n=2 Tax=Micromonospora TaxID=1873 RepID=A0AAU8HAV5_9ACTN